MVKVLAAVAILAVLAAQVAVVTRLRARDAARPEPRPTPAPRPTTTARPTDGRLVAYLRRHPLVVRILSVGSTAALIVAVAVLGYPLYTNLQADRLQGRLRGELNTQELRQDYADCRSAVLEFRDPACRIQEGDSLTRIQIPDIAVDVVVVQGVSASALRAGAGHYPQTPLPCESGNVGIAGHRTTYGRPFNNLDLLKKRTDLTPGSMITLQTPLGQCTYEVTDIFIVSPSEVSVIANSADDQLTLTTCHPKGSAAQRLIVKAELVDGAIPPADAAA